MIATAPPVKAFSSRLLDEHAAVDDLVHQIEGANIGFLLFFCSAAYNLAVLAAAFTEKLPTLLVCGCTTAGELTERGYESGSISAIGFEQDAFAVKAGFISQLEQFDILQAQHLIDGLLLGNMPAAGQQRFAMTLIDGLSAQEEMVLLALQTALGGIEHFGGSAGDNNILSSTHIYYEGHFYTNAAIVLMFSTAIPFRVFSSHHLTPHNAKLVVTAASDDLRTVFELNAEPAATAYAALIGVSESQLTPSIFALHPLAVRIGDDFYVRSIQKVNANGSLTFYCAVGLGAVLTQMTGTPIVDGLAGALTQIEQHIGQPELIIACDCVLRRLEIEEHNHLEQASAFLQQHKIVGFNTYGEHYSGVHLNQTFTGVAIGRAR